jgi:hypothetical protein
MQIYVYICISIGQVWQGIAGTHEPPAIDDRDGQQEGQARTAALKVQGKIEGAPN